MARQEQQADTRPVIANALPVVPFTTHAGSGLGNVSNNLHTLIPGAKFLEGLAVSGVSVDGARDEVTAWATGLGIA